MKSSTNRRTFLATAAALTAAVKLPRIQARSSAGELKLGVASYSLRKFSRPDAIKILKQIKVTNVSIKSFHLPYELPAAELTSGSDDFRNAGITVLSGGNINLKNPAELRKMFEYAKGAGIPMMVCAPSPETMDAVEELVKEFDIKIAIHNHGPEDKQFPTPESALKAVDGRDYRLGLCIDIGHTTRTGADVVEWIRRAGPPPV